jgi:tripartite-type tricarboxylate transporter receptor subunit TctC
MQAKASYLSFLVTMAFLFFYQPGAAATVPFPNRAVRLIVPFGPGGGTDIVARLLAQELGQAWKQNVVIDNREGGGSTIGTSLAARADPDGHTLVIVTATFAINPSLHRKLPYDSVRDFIPVSQVTSSQYVIAVHPAVPATSMQQLIALARSTPGKIAYATAGNGSSGHLGMELLKTMTGLDMVHVPYKGTGPATVAVVGGQVQVIMGSTTAALPHIRSNRLRPLAVSTQKRFPILPDVPTVAEAGLPGYEVDGWYGILAPARTPMDRVHNISKQLALALHTPELKERLSRDGVEVRGTSPEDFARYIKAEMTQWAKVVTAAKVRID